MRGTCPRPRNWWAEVPSQSIWNMQLSDVTFRKRELLLESSGWTQGLCTCPPVFGALRAVGVVRL